MAVVSENKYSRSAFQANTCVSISLYGALSVSDQLQADFLECLKRTHNSDWHPSFQTSPHLVTGVIPSSCSGERTPQLGAAMEASGSGLRAGGARFLKDNKHFRFSIPLKLWKRLKGNTMENHIDYRDNQVCSITEL